MERQDFSERKKGLYDPGKLVICKRFVELSKCKPHFLSENMKTRKSKSVKENIKQGKHFGTVCIQQRQRMTRTGKHIDCVPSRVSFYFIKNKIGSEQPRSVVYIVTK